MNDLFKIVTWPDVQMYMEVDGFRDNAILINETPLLEKYGSSAYIIDTDWLHYANNIIVASEPETELFDFFLDTETILYKREYFTVEAMDLVEAKEKAIDMVVSGEYERECYDMELLEDTERKTGNKELYTYEEESVKRWYDREA